MIPSIKATFNLTAKTVTIEDLFNYSGLTYASAFGNVIAKLGNTIFHTNSNYDSSADIVVGTNNTVTFNLLTDSNGNECSVTKKGFIDIRSRKTMNKPKNILLA
jgi:hypothetical protein